MESGAKNDSDKQAAGSIIRIRHLMECLQRVKDGRKRRGVRYPLEVIGMVFILAKLCGENKI